MVTVVSSHVGGEKPLHPSTQVAVPPRPEHQVEVIGHEAIGEDSHRPPSTGFIDEAHERLVVLRLVEHPRASVAAIDHVITDIADRSPCRPRHVRMLFSRSFAVKQSRMSPFPLLFPFSLFLLACTVAVKQSRMSPFLLFLLFSLFSPTALREGRILYERPG